MLSQRARLGWRIAQAAVWLVGAAIVGALLFAPRIGIAAFWNVLIPVAPALLVFAPGLWRNVCPLGTTSLLARHAGWSARRRVSPVWQARLHAIGVAGLLLIVPLRQVVLNRNGPATAGVLVGLAVIAFALGRRFDWKSGWCSGACPVHPVERLYGSRPALAPPNAHCSACERCTLICPDSVPGMQPITARDSRLGLFLSGGFPGFVWGWFQAADGSGFAASYGWSFAGLVASLALFLALRAAFPWRARRTLVRAFAAAAVACYYWYRIPMLVGFGTTAGDGLLVDLSASLPGWFPHASHAATTLLFLGWFLVRPRPIRSWCVRPEFAVQTREG